MKMICDVPDEVIKCIKDGMWCGSHIAEKMITNGIPLSSMEEPCEDAISRQEAIDACLNGWNKDYKEIVEEIRTLPPVTPQPKTGRWINAKVGRLFPSNDFKCSECGNILDFNGVNCGRGDANFCPNCGAKMAESEV